MSQSLSTPNPDPAGSHPPVETWIDYFTGSLPGREAEGLSRHLTRCRRCIDLVLDLDAFADPRAPRAGAAADFEKTAVWRTVEGDLEPRPATSARRWPMVTAVAASLLFATVGFSAWNEQRSARVGLESKLAALSSPQPNILIVDLRPGARKRSSGGVDATVELPAGGGPIALILTPEDDVDFPAYEARIVDAAGDEIARISGLEITDFGNFRLALPPGALAAGSYELRLFGLGEGRGQLIETYPIRLR